MPSRVVLLALALQCQAVDWHNSTSATGRDPIARLLAVAGDATQSSEALAAGRASSALFGT